MCGKKKISMCSACTAVRCVDTKRPRACHRSAAHDYVNDDFNCMQVCGEHEEQRVQKLAARASTLVMPMRRALQVGQCACTVVDCFPDSGAGALLSLAATNCSGSQARKSQLTHIFMQVADAIDKKVLEMATFAEQGFLPHSCECFWKIVRPSCICRS